ncbi:exocyst subunit SEC10 NDAI_0G02290 [Naumovozyma dairenensis CBS 421]|uniref:Uncharacterized protein n=1 Tax=Naumovozyma dairenensis (strain ATCC 10597 / BCRC 20456 / CBS 421 / NBRC 0211 / NRRL Y-12639) TaxID=1071378 RepID=G0WDZ3_NAUDC|nr:hypothetical protein NDAI_0G02290 [Naumovozyma dairenensis CBS 421]CCD26004.2 hypothetical protein NDAI_0G02290 [Naumovozyma dairenensis CBS 421]
MNSLYELDPKWRKLLNANNFLGGLTVNEFVEELSKDHSLRSPLNGKSSSARNSKHFVSDSVDGNDNAKWVKLDPKPYIRTFESTLKELKNLNEDSEKRKNQLADQVASQELLHSHNILGLSSTLKNMVSQYDYLDNQLTTVTQVVSPLGDKLENAIRKKKTYINSVELIIQYNEFYSNGESEYIETLRNDPNWLQKLKACNIVKNLLVLSLKIETSSIPKTLEVTKLIEKYSELMENDLLAHFNSAYRENNFNQLNEIALILNHFNGGVNVIQSFINQHSYFIDTAQIDFDETTETFLDEKLKNRLLDQDSHGVIYDEAIIKILDEIETVIKNESKIVKRVFEDRAPHVIQLFIQRIFAQKIEPRFELSLNASLSFSNLAYVRTLHGLYSILGQFVKDLSEFFQLLEIDKDNVLTNTVEQCYSDFFSRYLYDRSKYFEIEKQSLESILLEKTAKFNSNHEKEIRSRSLLNKFNKNIENNTYEFNDLTGTTNNSRSRLSQLNSFLKNHLDRDHLSLSRANTLNFNNYDDNDINNSNINMTPSNITSKDNIFQDAYDEEFSLTNVDSMLKCIVESVARVMELIPNKDVFTFELVDIMFMGIIGTYVEISLELAYSHICQIDISKESDINLKFLKYISTSTSILSLISTSIKAIFLPLLNNSPETKKQIIELTNKQIKRSELLINTILEEIIQVYDSKFSHSLSKQKKKDFVPKSQDLLDQDTLPAIEIVSLLNSLYSQSSQYLKKKNLEGFLNAIGEDLYNLLLAHYAKFQVSSIGGIIVTKDIIGYQNTIEEWRIPNLLEKFATLRELANLFTVQPVLLDSLTREGHLADISKEVISNYIANREDFNHENFITSMKLKF